jgi:DNA-binding GntR family transcriptional regulator
MALTGVDWTSRLLRPTARVADTTMGLYTCLHPVVKGRCRRDCRQYLKRWGYTSPQADAIYWSSARARLTWEFACVYTDPVSLAPTPARRFAADDAARALRSDILEGRLPGGTRLQEVHLAKRLSVSRTPVREAISRLVTEGLVIRDATGAASVFQPTVADLTEIYEIRVPLESLAATLAVQRSTPAYASAIRDRLDELNRAQPGHQRSRSHDLLHMDLYENCGRPRLVTLLRTLRAQSEPYVRLASQIDQDFARIAHDQHVQMVEMVSSGNAAGIDAVVRDHLRITLERAPKILGLH